MKKTESIGMVALVSLPKALTLVFVLALFLVTTVVATGTQPAHATNGGVTVGANQTIGITQNGTNYGTLTAPSGTPVESIRVVPTVYAHLNGTWDLVGKHSSASGIITFGAEPMKCNWCRGNEFQSGFTGVFGGVPVKGTYTYALPSSPSPYPKWPGDLSLSYVYHGHKVLVTSGLSIEDPNHMEMQGLAGSADDNTKNNGPIPTGLHIHPALVDSIDLIRTG